MVVLSLFIVAVKVIACTGIPIAFLLTYSLWVIKQGRDREYYVWSRTSLVWVYGFVLALVALSMTLTTLVVLTWIFSLLFVGAVSFGEEPELTNLTDVR